MMYVSIVVRLFFISSHLDNAFVTQQNSKNSDQVDGIVEQHEIYAINVYVIELKWMNHLCLISFTLLLSPANVYSIVNFKSP